MAAGEAVVGERKAAATLGHRRRADALVVLPMTQEVMGHSCTQQRPTSASHHPRPAEKAAGEAAAAVAG